MNQKTSLLPRVDMSQYWRLRFVKSEREYKEVMEERERSRLGLVGWIATQNIRRAKKREDRESRREAVREGREAPPPGFRLRFWRKPPAAALSKTEETPAEGFSSPPSKESELEPSPVDAPPSATDRLLGRIVWGEDDDPFVSESRGRKLRGRKVSEQREEHDRPFHESTKPTTSLLAAEIRREKKKGKGGGKGGR